MWRSGPADVDGVDGALICRPGDSQAEKVRTQEGRKVRPLRLHALFDLLRTFLSSFLLAVLLSPACRRIMIMRLSPRLKRRTMMTVKRALEGSKDVEGWYFPSWLRSPTWCRCSLPYSPGISNEGGMLRPHNLHVCC